MDSLSEPCLEPLRDGVSTFIHLDAGENTTPATCHDVVALDATRMRRTPQGGLRGPAALTKVGVFRYTHQDGARKGQVVREYRPAEEVFAPESLASLNDAPITDFHPSRKQSKDGLVHPDNFSALSKGHVTGVGHETTHVTADAVIQDETVAKLVLEGKRIEFSCGYQHTRDWTPGVFDGQEYDLIQRNIRYNHVALLPRGGGRQGADVALRFDSVIVKEIQMIISLDGKEYDLADDAQRKSYHSAMQAKADAAVATADAATVAAKKLADEATARFDAAEAELKPLRAAKAAEARTALETSATKLVKDLKFDGLTDRAVKEAVIVAKTPGAKLVGVSDDYVNARFDALLEQTPTPDAALVAARAALAPPGQNPDNSNAPSAPAWATRWTEPLTASKDKKDPK